MGGGLSVVTRPGAGGSGVPTFPAAYDIDYAGDAHGAGWAVRHNVPLTAVCALIVPVPYLACVAFRGARPVQSITISVSTGPASHHSSSPPWALVRNAIEART